MGEVVKGRTRFFGPTDVELGSLDPVFRLKLGDFWKHDPLSALERSPGFNLGTFSEGTPTSRILRLTIIKKGFCQPRTLRIGISLFTNCSDLTTSGQMLWHLVTRRWMASSSLCWWDESMQLCFAGEWWAVGCRSEHFSFVKWAQFIGEFRQVMQAGKWLVVMDVHPFIRPWLWPLWMFTRPCRWSDSIGQLSPDASLVRARMEDPWTHGFPSQNRSLCVLGFGT